MADKEARRAWVVRVLGVTPPAAEPDGMAPIRDRRNRPPPPLLPLWQEARDLVDRQLSRLEQACRGTGLPLGQAVADRGLSGMLAGGTVGLTAALLDLDRAHGEERRKAAARVGSAVDRARQDVASSEALTLFESNPFGVPVLARSVLDAALVRIQAALRA